jgi:AraC-like DNA-binding protein
METIKEHFDLVRSSHITHASLLTAQFTTFNFKRHAHEEYGIGVPKHGTQSFYCNGSYHEVKKSGIITFNQDDLHDGHAGQRSGLKYEMLYIQPEVISQLAGQIFRKQAGTFAFRQTCWHNPKLATQLLCLFNQFKDKSADPLFLQDLFLKQIAETMRLLGGMRSEMQILKPENQLIEKACDYMQDNYQQKITLEEMARLADTSAYHFSRLFTRTRGLSPFQYLSLIRVRKAKHAIEAGKDLSDTAHLSGFCDQSHLNRRFKEVYGVTPGAYRQKIR